MALNPKALLDVDRARKVASFLKGRGVEGSTANALAVGALAASAAFPAYAAILDGVAIVLLGGAILTPDKGAK